MYLTSPTPFFKLILTVISIILDNDCKRGYLTFLLIISCNGVLVLLISEMIENWDIWLTCLLIVSTTLLLAVILQQKNKTSKGIYNL